MKKLAVASILFTLLAGCYHKKVDTKVARPLLIIPLRFDAPVSKKDSSDLYAVLTFNSEDMSGLFPTSYKAVSLDSAELKTIDSLIILGIKKFNKRSKFYKIGDLKNYRRQIVAAKSTKGIKNSL